MYEQIKTKKDYDSLLKSGMFWEFHPELSGNWEEDSKLINPVKKKLLISFSGGKTSAYMLWWLWNIWDKRHEYEIIVVFANTGKETSETLAFVHKCSWKWNIPVVWIEATHKDENGKTYSKKGWKVKCKIVDYFSASRKGEPFEEMISVLGIPSTNAPFCSKQLKKSAIESYCKAIGWKDYYKAIGLRTDEKKRMDAKFIKNKVLYPFILLNPQTKKSVNAWWDANDFNLENDIDLGNCDNCWKKDLPRLARNARNYPETFDWWKKMTDLYGHLNPRNTDLKPPFNFYRGNLSVGDIFEISKLKDRQIEIFAFKEGIGRCGESCEAF